MRTEFSVSHLKRLTEAISFFLEKEMELKFNNVLDSYVQGVTNKEFAVYVDFKTIVDTEEAMQVEGYVMGRGGVAVKPMHFRVEVNAHQTDDCVWI